MGRNPYLPEVDAHENGGFPTTPSSTRAILAFPFPALFPHLPTAAIEEVLVADRTFSTEAEAIEAAYNTTTGTSAADGCAAQLDCGE